MKQVYSLKSVVVLMLFLFSVQGVMAVNRTWTNGAGDNLWNNPNNWSPVGVPGGVDDAYFNTTSTANCSINANASFRDLFVQSGYTGVISVSAGSTFNCRNFNLLDGTFTRSADAFAASGNMAINNATFNHSSAAMSVSGNITVTNNGIFSTSTGSVTTGTLTVNNAGAVFNAPSNGLLTVKGNLTWSAGTFNHNSGTLRIESPGNMTLDVPTTGTFNVVEIANNNGQNTSVSAGDQVTVLRRLTLENGDMTGGGAWNVEDTMVVLSTFDNGGVAINFTGPASGEWFAEKGLTSSVVTINKSTSATTVTVWNGASTVTTFEGTVNITSGNLIMAGDGDVDWNGVLTVGANGTWTLPDNDAVYFSSDLTINGTLVPQLSTFIADHPGNRTYNATGIKTFNNFTLNGNNGQNWTMTGDTILVTGTLTLLNSDLIGGVAQISGDLSVQPGIDAVTTELMFVGNTNSNWYADEYVAATVIVAKSTNTNTVFVSNTVPDATNGTIKMGGSNGFGGTLNIEKGRLTVENTSRRAHLYFSTVIVGVQPARLTFPNGDTIENRGNWEIRGTISSGNSRFWYTPAGNRTWNTFGTGIKFFNIFIMDANNGQDLDLTGDSIASNNRFVFMNGQVQNGRIFIRNGGDLFLLTGLDGGSAVVEFDGGSTFGSNWYAQAYWATSYLINKSQPTQTVTVRPYPTNNPNESYIGSATGGSGSLTVDQGVLRFLDNRKHNVGLNTNTTNGLVINTNGSVQWAQNDTVVFNGGIGINGGTTIPNGPSTVIIKHTGTRNTNFSGDSIHFYHLVIDGNNGQNLNAVAGDIWNVNGDLTLVNGDIINVEFDLKGNVVMAASMDATNTASIKFSGGPTQYIDASADSAIWNGAIIIDQPVKGYVVLSSPFSLDFGSSFNTVTFTKGLLVSTKVNMLTLVGDFKQFVGGNDSSFINGPVRRRGRHSVASPFVFVIGQEVDGKPYYRPLTVSNTATNPTPELRAEYYHANPDWAGLDTGSKAAPINHVSSVEWWSLTRVGAGANNQRVTLSWGNTSGVADLTSLLVARWDGTQWVSEGQSSNTGTTASGTVTSNNYVADYTFFTLATNLNTTLNPLPVTFLGINAQRAQNGTGLVKWKIAMEENCSHYEVMRSADGQVFDVIGTVNSLGNTQEQRTYSFIDNRLNEISNGYVYYRIKQYDLNGHYSFSETAVIYPRQSDFSAAVQIYPNPAGNMVYVKLNEDLAENSEIRLIDVKGNVIQNNISANAAVDLSDFTPGVYFIEVSNPQGRWIEKIIHN